MRIEHNRVDFTIHGSECFPVILEFAVDIPGQNAIRQYFHILGAFSPRINFFPALNSPDHLSHRPFIFTLRSDHVRSSFGPVYHGWQRADKRSRGYPRVRKPRPVRGGGRKGGEFHGMGLVIIFWNRAWMRLGMVYFPPDRRVGQIQARPQKKSSRKTGKLPPEAAGTGRSLAIST